MRFKNFEIIPTVYLDGHKEPYDYQLVKINGDQNFAVAKIRWNRKEYSWEFASYGTRFLDYYEDGLVLFVRKSVELFEMVRQFSEE